MATKKESPCQQGGAELLPFFIKVPASAEVQLKLQVCGSRGRVAAFLDDARLMDQDVDKDGSVELTLDAMAPGFHALHWSLLVVGEEWEMRSEVAVGGVDRFRQRKGSASDLPYNHSFVILEAR